MSGEPDAVDFRTRDRALAVLEVVRAERAELADEESRVSASLLASVFESAWTHQFDANRRQFKQEVAEAVAEETGA